MRKTNVRVWVCLLILFLAAGVKAEAQTWSFTGSMGAQRAFHTATVLNNGEVLVVGGRNRTLYGPGTAELYDPASGTFSPTGSLQNRRAQHTATLLQNG
jgi:hypothetical protein